MHADDRTTNPLQALRRTRSAVASMSSQSQGGATRTWPSRLITFRIIALLAATVFFYPLGLQAEQPPVATAKPQEGVFVSREGFAHTLIELKGGRYRLWSWGHFSGEKPVSPSSTGEYVFEGDTVVLKLPDKSESILKFRTLNGLVTLWRPKALQFYDQKQQLDEWNRGILFLTTRTPEEILDPRPPQPK